MPSPLNCCAWGYSFSDKTLTQPVWDSDRREKDRQTDGWQSVNNLSWHYSRKSAACIVGIYFCSLSSSQMFVFMSVIQCLHCCNFVGKFWSREVWIFLFDSFLRFFRLLHLSCICLWISPSACRFYIKVGFSDVVLNPFLRLSNIAILRWIII